MGRDAGAHAYGNALRSINQKVGDPHRKDLRLPLRLIIIRDKIYRLVQVLQIDLLGKFFQPCLGVAHGRSPVPLDGAEVSVSVHQGHPLLKLLAQHHQRIVDGAVPMGVVLTHGIAYNTGRLSVRLIVVQMQLAHVIEHPALYRL